jgi:protein-S-isoprenylcysteine O-methyltransferase Ste14
MTHVVRAYGYLAYTAFVVSALWGVGFLADAAAPTTVDGAPGAVALVIDLGLLLIFAVQHSVMARAGFKRFLPAEVERSTYVLAASLALVLVFGQWRAMPASIWRVDAQPWAALIWVVYGIGWAITVSATFMVDHLDFLGIRQSRGVPYEAPGFGERWLYAWVRHPMMLGLVIAFWATPRMTVGHLVFAMAGTAYIGVGVWFEERDLRRSLGETYVEYATRVPALIPRRPER